MSDDLIKKSLLFGDNAVFIEQLYQKYLKNPSEIDKEWRGFFENYSQNDESHLGFNVSAKTTSSVIDDSDIIISNTKNIIDNNNLSSKETTDFEASNLKAKFMIDAYRAHGHRLVDLDPLSIEKPSVHKDFGLLLQDFGFTNSELDLSFKVESHIGNQDRSHKLSELFDFLNKVYANKIAVEFAHVEDTEEQNWLYERLEEICINDNNLDNEKRKKILRDLAEVEGFEQFLHKKFPGAKRFSIEGGESAILVLDHAIDMLAQYDTKEVVIGLAHRGRLSTLTKIMKKPYPAIFSEFMGKSAFPADLTISGDVKYHMGYSNDRVTACGKQIHLSLNPNPSHLEAVNPVVAGKVRAKQRSYNEDQNSVSGILVHGDAAFCGQGVVAETLAMSRLKPYDVGGIIHVVINNQIGFTTNYRDARAGRYCTEVAKILGTPILHVNGDDIESALIAAQIALEYKHKFKRDVVIDIVCYRKYGHNEGDEPMYTQSVMYNIIKQKKSPAELYANFLTEQNIIDQDEFSKIKNDIYDNLSKEFTYIEGFKPVIQWMSGKWSNVSYTGNKEISYIQDTGVNKEKLLNLGVKLNTIPENFDCNKKLQKLFTARLNILDSDQPIDWALGEQLAFASILSDQTAIRFTGQDVERGTFSHRHAVLHSQSSGEEYIPLNNFDENQALCEIHDSNLSEYGVLGFEYGYSLVNPNNLVLWEAQFGDFANGAQIIFDQFILSGETKWMRMSGLVVLLPHGYEGQGPEHSSARLERFLQMGAENNVRIAYPTTPASIFHLLRRQVAGDVRKPLIIMSPKSLLRNKLATSKLDDLAEGTKFLPVIDEIDNNITKNADKVKKLVFCTGKIYYDLLAARMDNKIDNIAIIRIEELYPLSYDCIINVLKRYKSVEKILWVQEEHKNMGAWSYIRPHISKLIAQSGLKHDLCYVGRSAAASPAVGYLYVHNKQQERIINDALDLKSS